MSQRTLTGKDIGWIGSNDVRRKFKKKEEKEYLELDGAYCSLPGSLGLSKAQ